MSLHLFKSIQWLFRNYFNIFLAWFCKFFVKCIPKYFIFFVNIANGIFTSIITSVDCLHVLILYHWNLVCVGFLTDSLGYTTELEFIFYPIRRERWGYWGFPASAWIFLRIFQGGNSSDELMLQEGGIHVCPVQRCGPGIQHRAWHRADAWKGLSDGMERTKACFRLPGDSQVSKRQERMLT